jgi:hypothetical protein
MKKLLSLLFLVLLAACQIADATADAPTRNRAAEAADATYRIVAYDGDALSGARSLWQGTAWKLSDTKMITAGHVCDDSDWQAWNPDAAPTQFRLHNAKGQSWPVEVVAYELDETHDLCLLRIAGEIPGMPLSLAKSLPAYDAELMYTGAPHGIWEDGMRPVYHGRYAGGSLAIIGGAPGASGSAMLSADGVVGVLVAGIESGNLIFFIPLQDLLLFLIEYEDF